MKTTPFLAEKDVETDPNIMDNIGEKDEGLSPGAHRRARVLERSPFRYSLASQYSSTSASGSSHSQRFSIASTDSNNGQERIDNTFIPHRRSGDSGSFEHVPQPSSPTGTSFSSLPPSSRYLLSGATSSETFREQELSRFYPTNKLRHIKALSDPYVSMPCIALSTLPVETHSNFSHERLSPEPFDPWCMSVKVALDNAICSGWLHKHDPPSFAFQRSWKRRFVVLVDRIVYIFKSDKATNPAREHFLLTDDTLVFVSEEFKRGFVLELRKPLCKWFLRCESAAEMKFWLEAMKKIVACSKLGHRGAITASILATLKLTDDFHLLTVASPTPQQSTSLTSNKRPPSTVNINSQRISSRAEHRSAILRASLPPSASRTEQPGKNKLSWMDYSDGNINRRGSMPLGSPRQSTKTVIDKRRSLAQIPGWEHALPPQMPPPRSCPPSVPVADDAPRSSLETVRED